MNWRGARGQSSVELVAVLPALVMLTLAVAGIGAHGFAWLEARSAARLAQRSEAAGGKPAAGLEGLTPALRRGARLRRRGDTWEVSVSVPITGRGRVEATPP